MRIIKGMMDAHQSISVFPTLTLKYTQALVALQMNYTEVIFELDSILFHSISLVFSKLCFYQFIN